MKHVLLVHDSDGRALLTCRNCAARLELDRAGDLPAQMAPFLDGHERPHLEALRCAV